MIKTKKYYFCETERDKNEQRSEKKRRRLRMERNDNILLIRNLKSSSKFAKSHMRKSGDTSYTPKIKTDHGLEAERTSKKNQKKV